MAKTTFATTVVATKFIEANHCMLMKTCDSLNEYTRAVSNGIGGKNFISTNAVRNIIYGLGLPSPERKRATVNDSSLSALSKAVVSLEQQMGVIVADAGLSVVAKAVIELYHDLGKEPPSDLLSVAS